MDSHKNLELLAMYVDPSKIGGKCLVTISYQITSNLNLEPTGRPEIIKCLEATPKFATLLQRKLLIIGFNKGPRYYVEIFERGPYGTYSKPVKEFSGEGETRGAYLDKNELIHYGEYGIKRIILGKTDLDSLVETPIVLKDKLKELGIECIEHIAKYKDNKLLILVNDKNEKGIPGYTLYIASINNLDKPKTWKRIYSYRTPFYDRISVTALPDGSILMSISSYPDRLVVLDERGEVVQEFKDIKANRLATVPLDNSRALVMYDNIYGVNYLILEKKKGIFGGEKWVIKKRDKVGDGPEYPFETIG